MKSVSFSITQVNRLRSAAVEARTLLAERPDPWPVRDADDLIRVFDTLWLKAGFALHAYDSGGSARGIIWAVPGAAASSLSMYARHSSTTAMSEPST